MKAIGTFDFHSKYFIRLQVAIFAEYYREKGLR